MLKRMSHDFVAISWKKKDFVTIFSKNYVNNGNL